MAILSAFTPTDASADVRATLNSVLSRVFDVRLYGAVADSNGTQGNGTDNTAAFQAAINAAQTAGGGVVFLPPGTYRLATATLAITASNIQVRGSGRGTSALFFDSADITSFGRLIFDGGASSGTITNVSAEGFTIFNRSGVQCNALSPYFQGYEGQACGLTFRGCARFHATDIEIYGMPNYCLVAIRSTDGSISKNYLHDNTADGVHLLAGCQRVAIHENKIVECGDDGIGFGYGGAANVDCLTWGNVISGIGACGIAVYGPAENISLGPDLIDSTWNSGIKLLALTDDSNHNSVVSYLKGIKINGSVIANPGMRLPAAFSRGQGIACGIHISPYGGSITDLLIDGIVMRNARSSFVIVDPTNGGTVALGSIQGSVFDGIAATGGQGNTTSGSTGISQDTPDTTHPGITISATVLDVRGNIVNGAVGSPILQNGTAVTTNNVVAASAPVVSVADNFNRADVAPAAGALGTTSTGGKTWVGDAAGIASQQAYLSTSGSRATFVNFGAADVDVSITVVVATAGQGGRVIARNTGASNGAYLILGTGGEFLYYDTPNAKAYYITGNASTGSPAGTYTLRLVVKGNLVTGYINGTQVGSDQPKDTSGNVFTMPQNTYIGFQDAGGPGGTARYDNFSAASPS